MRKMRAKICVPELLSFGIFEPDIATAVVKTFTLAAEKMDICNIQNLLQHQRNLIKHHPLQEHLRICGEY